MCCYIPNTKALGLVVSYEKIFSCFSYISLCKICDPWMSQFWPQGHNLNKLVQVHYMNLHIKYRGPLCLMVSDKKIYSCFPYISLCKKCDQCGHL